jgi:hypothetical protein
MAKYRIETDQGTFEVETEESTGKPDAFQQAVTYKTGSALVDAPLGLLQGAAKGAASTGVGIGSVFRKVADCHRCQLRPSRLIPKQRADGKQPESLGNRRRNSLFLAVQRQKQQRD